MAESNGKISQLSADIDGLKTAKEVSDSSFVSFDCVLLWPPCVADADIIFLPCDFYLFYSSPNLSDRRLDVYHNLDT